MIPSRRTLAALALTTLTAGGLVMALSGPASAARPFASVKLSTAAGLEIGSATFTNRQAGLTTVVVNLDIPDGVTSVRAFHGFHVHANDVTDNGAGCVADPAADPTTWFTSADGHYKATDETHASHLGDMPSLLVNSDGTASATFSTDRFTPDTLRDRVVILHAGADNFGNVPVGTLADQYSANSEAALTKTQGTGNAGNRVACGVIAIPGR